MEKKNKLIALAVLVVLILVAWFAFSRDGSDEAPTAEYASSIVGSWQSVELPQLVRHFESSGVVTDQIGSEEIAGTWQIFDKGNAPEVFGVNFDEEMVYLQTNMTGDARDTMYFHIVVLDDEELELVYLGGRVDPMRFTRVEE